MHPLAVGPAPRILAGCDDLAAHLADPARGVCFVVVQQGVVTRARDFTTANALPGTLFKRSRSESFQRLELAPVMSQLAPVPPLSALMIP